MGILVTTDSSRRSAVIKAGDLLDGRYRIVRTIGTGSMGAVYLAEQVAVKRPVAIKILRSTLGGDAEGFDGYLTEAEEAGSLGHPNIVGCSGTGFTSAQTPYVVLEYLDGAVLGDEIHRLGGLPVGRALNIADQIAAALGAAHGASIVHGSLSSDSVFLLDRPDARDLVKVLDFGVARLFGLPDGSRNGVATGDPEFMAPEQLAAPEIADRRSDVYALGVMLYEMLTARRPFGDDDRHAPPPPLPHGAPDGLEQLIVSRLLAADPAERCATMAEVQAALAPFAELARSSSSAGFPEANEVTAVIGNRRADAASRRAETASRRAEAATRRADTASRRAEAATRRADTASGRADTAPRRADTARDRELLPVPAEAVALPALPPRRSLRVLWLLAAVLSGAAGTGAMYLEDQTRTAARQLVSSALDGDAEMLGSLIDTEIRGAHLRADGVAAMPMLRAAIETDAATLKDMAGSDFIFTPRRGEVLELFQIRGSGAPASVLRIPDSAAAIPAMPGNRTRVVKTGDQITIVVGAPIARTRAGISGSVALATPVDLSPLKRRIADHARSAALIGLGTPLQLAGATAAAAAGPAITIPVTLGPDLEIGEIALTAVVAPPAMRPELRIGGLASWGLAGVLLALFVATLFRRRTLA